MADRKIETTWLDLYGKYCGHFEMPRSYAFWSGVSTIAGALGRKTWYDFGGLVYPCNFYIILIGPAGLVQKSSAIKKGVNLLKQVPKLVIGPDTSTWEALLEMLEQTGKRTTQRKHYIDGVEKKLVHHSMTLPISELDSFMTWDNFAVISGITDLWEGKSQHWKITKTAGTQDISYPLLNLIAGTTEGWIPQSQLDRFIQSGFTSRTIFVYEQSRSQLVAYPNIPEEKHLAMTSLLVKDLTTIHKLEGKIHLTAEAMEWGTLWYQENYKAMVSTASNRVRSYLSRKQKHLHALAYILAVSERNTYEVELRHMQQAFEELALVEGKMDLLFDDLAKRREYRAVEDVIRWTQRKGTVTLREFLAYIAQSYSLQERKDIREVFENDPRISKSNLGYTWKPPT